MSYRAKVNRANGTRENDHRANGNRADVLAPKLAEILGTTTLPGQPVST